jgi:hypothetical protein
LLDEKILSGSDVDESSIDPNVIINRTKQLYRLIKVPALQQNGQL